MAHRAIAEVTSVTWQIGQSLLPLVAGLILGSEEDGKTQLSEATPAVFQHIAVEQNTL
jgi:hypothetical protein